MVDEPLLSPCRIWGGIRLWFWLIVVMEVDLKASLWQFIVYHRRPEAAEKAGKY